MTLILLGTLSTAHAQKTPPYKEWGAETLKMIKKDYWQPKRELYAEHSLSEKRKGSAPAFMWGVGVQLSAMAAASKLEPATYLEETKAYADKIQVYWLKHNNIEGFDVQPGPKESDRYYDDNAWLVLALAEVFEISKDKKYLDQAEATFKFVISGEDDKLGGGIYWREKELTSKNTCTNGPAIVSALRLYQLTKDEKYLTTAKRLYTWVNANLQDKDGLYWDNIRMDGKIQRHKFTYNTALMIRANCLFNEVTRETQYLREAKRVAKAAEKQWVQDNGAISDSGRFAHLLLESFIAIYQQDKDAHWLRVTEKTLKYVHSELLDDKGHYSSRWDRKASDSPDESEILNQSSPARAFWFTADVLESR